MGDKFELSFISLFLTWRWVIWYKWDILCVRLVCLNGRLVDMEEGIGSY